MIMVDKKIKNQSWLFLTQKTLTRMSIAKIKRGKTHLIIFYGV